MNKFLELLGLDRDLLYAIGIKTYSQQREVLLITALLKSYSI